MYHCNHLISLYVFNHSNLWNNLFSFVYGYVLGDAQRIHTIADKLCGSRAYVKSCIYSATMIWIFSIIHFLIAITIVNFMSIILLFIISAYHHKSLLAHAQLLISGNPSASTLCIYSFSAHYAVLYINYKWKTAWKASLLSIQPLQKIRNILIVKACVLNLRDPYKKHSEYSRAK